MHRRWSRRHRGLERGVVVIMRGIRVVRVMRVISTGIGV
jgi:hypothetical protein